MTRTALVIALACLFCAATTAHATNFAILFGDQPPKPDAPKQQVSNPLYQGSGQQGENPLYQPKSLEVSPQEIWPGMPSQFTISMDSDLPADLPTAPVGAFVFEALLTDLDNGQPIHLLDAPLNFYFNTDAPEGLTFDFGYLNEATGHWESMQLLKSDKGGQLCGTTSHLTVFYLAQVPEPASWVLMAAAALALGLARVSRRTRSRAPAC